MDNKSEKYLIKYLKSLPDNQIKQFYNGVEWTPYPVLVIKEFQRRFNPMMMSLLQNFWNQSMRLKVRDRKLVDWQN